MTLSDHKQWRGALYGLAYGIVVAGLVSIVFCAMATAFVFEGIRGVLRFPLALLEPITYRGWTWVVGASVLPVAAVCAWAGWLFARQSWLAQHIWLLGCISGFLAALFSSSIGPIWISSLLYGADRVNIRGYLMGGPVFALASFPLTAPVATAVLAGLRHLLQRSGIVR